jgi:methyl-accepting chemotaxis protein
MIKVSFFHSLRVRITLALALLVTSVMVLVFLALWLFLSAQENQTSRAGLDAVLQARVDDLTALAEKIDGQLQVYSSYQGLSLAKGATAPTPHFSAEISTAAAFPASGVTKSAAGTVIDIHERQYFHDIVVGADLAVSPAVLSKSDGKPTVIFARPRKDADGALVGVDVVTVSLKSLTEKIGSIHYGDAGFAWVIDKAGTILAHPNPDYIMKNIKDVPEGSQLSAAWAKGNFAEVTAPIFGLAPHVTHFKRTLHPAGWTVALSLPVTEFTKTVNAVTNLLIVALVLGLVLALLLGAVVARPLVRPILAAQRSFAQLAEGEADLTTTLAIKRHDELGVMVAHFNRFLGTLRGMVIQIHEAKDSIRRALDELEASAQANAAATRRIDGQVSEVHRQTEVQNRSVLQSSSAAEEIAANIESLDGVITDQAAAVTEASASVEQMARNIESVFNSMNSLSTEFQSLAQVAEGGRTARETTNQMIRAMVERSESLHEANDVIAHIASQTNLLAMNAAIEAAHAGEAGRGFAVVADEIRKLAENSAQQSKAIGQDIKAVETSIHDLVASSDVLGQSLEAVEGRIQGTRSIVRQIHDAMAEQKQGSDQMLEALQSLNQLTSTVKTGSEEMRSGNATLVNESQNLKDATAQIRQTVNDISAETKSLASAAGQVTSLVEASTQSLEGLEAQVSRFKI